ncbi:hypothetical protein SLE2022_143800 [Rubroshorea leprosula]
MNSNLNRPIYLLFHTHYWFTGHEGQHIVGFPVSVYHISERFSRVVKYASRTNDSGYRHVVVNHDQREWVRIFFRTHPWPD